MVSPGEFNRQLAAAARSMAEETSSQDVVARAVGLAVELIEGCDVAGVSVVRLDRIDTPAATSETLRLIDEAQFRMDEGPCLDALREHEVVTSDNLETDPRWPRWGPRMATEAGVRSCLSFRIFATGDSLGALNLYSHRTAGFTSDDVDNGLALAAQIAIALGAAQTEERLLTGLGSRGVIAQAQGVLMERYQLTSDVAFHVLVRFSRNLDLKLPDVARRIVIGGPVPDDQQ